MPISSRASFKTVLVLFTALLMLGVPTSLIAWAHGGQSNARLSPSPYQLCPKPLAKQPAQVLYSCAEQEFWHGLSDGSFEVRQSVEKHLTSILSLTAADKDRVKQGRMAGLRAYLRLALALENGRIEHVLLGGMERDFLKAMANDRANTTYKTFYDTIIIAKSAMMGDWTKAVKVSGPAFDVLAVDPINILSLSGTTIGFPLNTGVPQRTIAMMDAWVCPAEEKDFCTQNTQKAPFARPGLSFHFAEAYARVGDRAKTLAYLLAAQEAPGFEKWQHKELVEKPLADLDSYMAYWANFGEDGSAFDKVYANQPFGCVMCHGRW